MPTLLHAERHFSATETVRDLVLGMSDGLTVPFALAAGLSGAVSSAHIVVTAGLAEIAAGAISMGLGGYLAARTDADHYRAERRRELWEIDEMPEAEANEVRDVFRRYGLDDDQVVPVLRRLRQDRDRWADFMMRFELGLEPPDPGRARKSAWTLALAYVMGGVVPLMPYMLLQGVTEALPISVGATLSALFVFGLVKARFTGVALWRGGLQTVAIGSLAAAAAFSLARWIA